MKTRNRFLIIILGAVAIKLFLFLYAEFNAPQGKILEDSKIYLESGRNLVLYRSFALRGQDGALSPHLLRTPGYPLFVGILHGLMKIPLSGVILVQIFLTLLAAFFTYKTAVRIDPRLGFLSALIILYDPPVTIFSLMLLTETLFMFLISLFMYFIVIYLKEKKIKFILLCALIIAMSTYVRPVNYFLAVAIGCFLIFFAISTKCIRLIGHVLIFLVIAYSLVGLWHLRNQRVCGVNMFTSVTQLASSHRDEIKKETEITESSFSLPCYLNIVSRSLVLLMTHPGTLKNFSSGRLKKIGKILGYPWVVFWLVGFLAGIIKIGKNFYLQFLSLVVVYFICASIYGILLLVSSRQRVPMMPFIAIISANGWLWITSLLKTKLGTKF